MSDSKSTEQSFDETLLAFIQDAHPDWEADRVRSNANTVYNAAQCFPDENGNLEEVPIQQVLSCLKIWRAYDY